MVLRLHLLQNLRSAYFLAVLGVFLAIPLILWNANRAGLPDSWRALLEQELANQGMHLSIASIQYHPFRGVLAKNVRIFSDPDHKHEWSRIGGILLDFDKPKLARGQLRLKRLQLNDVDMWIYADSMDVNSDVLSLTGVRGDLMMPGGRVIEVRNAKGKVGDVDVVLNARLLGYRASVSPGFADDPISEVGIKRELVSLISREMERWSFPRHQAPSLTVDIHGDLSVPDEIRVEFHFHAEDAGANDHGVDEIELEGSLNGSLMFVDSLRLRDSRGELDGRLEYDFIKRGGRFEMQSTIDVVTLARRWAGINMPDDLLIGGHQSFDVSGGFVLQDDRSSPVIHAIGSLSVGAVFFRGVMFDQLETKFSSRDGDFYFRDFRIEQSGRVGTGHLMMEWPLMRLTLDSTLPLAAYLPIFRDQPLEKVIGEFTSDDRTDVRISLEGEFDLGTSRSWSVEGRGAVSGFAYREVPIAEAGVSFSLNRDEWDFRNGELVLDTSGYPQRLAYRGPERTKTRFGAIRYLRNDHVIDVRDVLGDFWVPPLIALFNTELARKLESYQFHRPPRVSGGGRIDLTGEGATRFEVRFASANPVVTDVLGKAVTFDHAKGELHLEGDKVALRNLKMGVFQGGIETIMDYSKDKLSFEIVWAELSLPKLLSTYGAMVQGGGTTSGKVAFDCTPGEVSTLQGRGNMAMNDARLFSVPILGPLSPLIATILDDKRTGYERAKDATMNYVIRDGVIAFDDFMTSTTSLKFIGEGQIDLNEMTVDMVMRVNARGLLGIVTLPLRPFYGLFQFRGSGPLRDPNWENVIFTPPAARQRQELLAPDQGKPATGP